MHILEKILDSKCLMAFEIGFVLLSCFELVVNTPRTDPTTD